MSTRVKSVFGRFGPREIAKFNDYSASMLTKDIQLTLSYPWPVDVSTLEGMLDMLEQQLVHTYHVGGDLEGDSAQTCRIARIRGVPVAGMQPNDGDYLVFSAARNEWRPQAVATTRVSPAPWKAIYSVDFGGAAFTTRVPGKYTISGADWWLKGNASTLPDCGITELGEGGELFLSASRGRDPAGADPEPYVYAGDHAWFLPFESIPGYSAKAPVAVLIKARSHAEITDVSTDNQGHTSYTWRTLTPYFGIASRLPSVISYDQGETDQLRQREYALEGAYLSSLEYVLSREVATGSTPLAYYTQSKVHGFVSYGIDALLEAHYSAPAVTGTSPQVMSETLEEVMSSGKIVMPWSQWRTRLSPGFHFGVSTYATPFTTAGGQYFGPMVVAIQQLVVMQPVR